MYHGIKLVKNNNNESFLASLETSIMLETILICYTLRYVKFILNRALYYN
jgi:hypothetical protein